MLGITGVHSECGLWLVAARRWWIIRWKQYFSGCCHVLVVTGRHQMMTLSVMFRFAEFSVLLLRVLLTTCGLNRAIDLVCVCVCVWAITFEWCDLFGMMICLDIICFKFRGQGHGSQFMEYVPFVGCGYSQLIKKQSGVGNITYSTVRETAQFQHGRGCALCCCK